MKVRWYALTLTAALLGAAGCAQPTTEPAAPDDQAAWSDVRQREFRAALKAARRQLMGRLLQVRVAPDTRLADLAAGKTLSFEEVYNLVRRARVTDLEWLSDGRCRLRLTLSLSVLVGIMESWDRDRDYVPHNRIYRLNDSPSVSVRATSPQDRPRVATD